MPVFNSKTLLHDLHKDVSGLLQALHNRIMDQPHALLLQQPAPGSWSVIQCLDHLNSYSRYYVPRLEAAIAAAGERRLAATTDFKSGWLGNYFTGMMQPRPDGALKSKMKAPKGYRPIPLPNATAVLTEFAAHQEQLLQLLQRAQQVNIAAVRIPITLTALIKLSIGDTFRFLIAHEQRHTLQALRALVAVTGNTGTAVSVQYVSGT